MDIDTFLDGGFEGFAPAEAKAVKKTKKKEKLIKQVMPEDPLASSPSSKTGKRAKKQGKDMAAGDGAVGAEITSHKEQLQALKTADPEFYQYLMDSDKALLDFSDDEEDGMPHGDEEMSEEEGGGAGEAPSPGSRPADTDAPASTSGVPALALAACNSEQLMLPGTGPFVVRYSVAGHGCSPGASLRLAVTILNES